MVRYFVYFNCLYHNYLSSGVESGCLATEVNHVVTGDGEAGVGRGHHLHPPGDLYAVLIMFPADIWVCPVLLHCNIFISFYIMLYLLYYSEAGVGRGHHLHPPGDLYAVLIVFPADIWVCQILFNFNMKH